MTVGDAVVLAPGVTDALDPGEVGDIVQDDKDIKPYKVKGRVSGKTTGYLAADSVRSVRTVGTVGTALHAAARAGHTGVCTLLLRDMRDKWYISQNNALEYHFEEGEAELWLAFLQKIDNAKE